MKEKCFQGLEENKCRNAVASKVWKKMKGKIPMVGKVMVPFFLSALIASAGIQIVNFSDTGTSGAGPVRCVFNPVRAQVGDMIVVMASTNKKGTAVPVSLVRAGGTGRAGAATELTNGMRTYPTSWGWYMPVTSAGTFDIELTATSITMGGVLYVVRADSGVVSLAGSAIWDDTDTADNGSSCLLNYSFETHLTDGVVIESVSARTDKIVKPAAYLEEFNESGKRVVASFDGATGPFWRSTYTLSGGVADKQTSGAVGMVFTEGIGNATAPMPPETSVTNPINLNAFAAGYTYSNSLTEYVVNPDNRSLTFSIEPANTWLSVAADGTISGTPEICDAGMNEWTVFLTDDTGKTNCATLRIEIVDGTFPPPQTDKTNVVLIVIDDLGWMDLSIQGSEFYETPRIDSLATNGMRFTQGYASHPRCLPSRYGLMTGRFPGASAVPGDAPKLIDKEVTIGEALQAGGYATFFAGKWHISHKDALLPQRQGFDINITGGAPGSPPSYFYPYGDQPTNELDRNGLFLDNATPIGGMVTDRITGASYLRTHSAGETGEYITDRLTDEALDWVTWNADKPFFLYMSHYGVHTPFEAPAKLVDKYKAKLATMDYGKTPDYIPVGVGEQKMRQDNPTYAAMIESVDTNIGRLMDKIEALGIASNTIFIFTADNGGLSNRGGYNGRELATSNYPLRTGKGWLYEGGIREAFIVKGPGIVPGVVNSNAVINGTDIYPTILEMTGQPLRPLDHRNGVSFMSALAGAPYDRGKPILWHSPLARPYSTGDFNSSALRDGDYKLIWWYDTPGQNGEFHTELYNVRTDPGETKDLSGSMPAKAADLLAQIKAWHNHKHWERGVGVIQKPDINDVSKPPQALLENPFVPTTIKNGILSWNNYVGYSYKLWTRTNRRRDNWTLKAEGLTTPQFPVGMNAEDGCYKVELILDPKK